MKTSNIIDATFFIWVGLWISNLIWHFRFENELLRREMLIFMTNENGYFLDWFILNSMFMFILTIVYTFYKVNKSNKEQI